MCKNEEGFNLTSSRFFYFSSISYAESSDVSITPVYVDSINNGSILCDYESSYLLNKENVFQQSIKSELHEENKAIEVSGTRTEIKKLDDCSSDTRFPGERTVTTFNNQSMSFAPMAIIGEDEKEVLQDIRKIMEEQAQLFSNLNDRFNFDNMDLVPGSMDGNWVTFFRILNKNVIDEITELNRQNERNFTIYFGKYFGAYSGSESSSQILDSDSPIVKVLKGQTTRLVNAMDNESVYLKYFGAYSGAESSYQILSDDSPIVKVLKGQTTRLVNAMEFSKYLGAYSGAEFSSQVLSDDSPIVKVMKGQTTRLVNAMNNEPVFLKYFGAYSGAEFSSQVLSDDSPIVKVLKGQTTRLVSAMDFSKYLGAYSGSESSSQILYDDSPIVKVLKGQTTRLVNAMDNESVYLKYFGAYSGAESSYQILSADSPIVKVLKGQTTRLVNAMEFSKYLGAYSGSESSSQILDSDSPIVKVLKGQTTRIVNAIQGIAGGVGGGESPKVFDDMLKSLEKIEKLISNFTKGFDSETGSSFWDFLSNFTGQLFDLVEFLVEKIIYLVIPEDSSQILNAFTTLSDTFDSKFSAVEQIKNEFNTSFNVEEKQFENVEINLHQYGSVKFFDTTYLKQAVPHARNLISGMMIIVTGFWAYRKISSGVIK